MSETHDEPVLASSSPTIGERLRQAREAKNYNVAEVAAQLRLTKDIVEYMENQQWDKLNGRTYARGYFANYVKFLGLPYEEMLAVFNHEYTVTESAPNLKHYGHGKDQDHAFPWFMLALIAIVLVVIWLAYQQWQQSQALLQSSNTSEQQSAELGQDDYIDSVVEPLDNNSASVTPQGSDTDPSAPLTQESLSATVDELGLSDDNLSEINAAEEINSASTAVGEETAMPDTGIVQSQPQIPAQTETPTQIQTVETAGSDTLRLNFSGECWVEVTDADAQVLVSQVMQAQDSLELSSNKPLSVLLGRAEAATVFFNNEQVDLKPHTTGDVARLTLGVES